MTKHAELIARLEAAEVGSRELDGCLYWALERPKAERAYWNAATGLPCALPDDFVPRGLGQLGVIAASSKHTTSLDCALALAERLGLDVFAIMYAAIMNWKAHDPRGPTSKALPLSICIAILKALEAKA